MPKTRFLSAPSVSSVSPWWIRVAKIAHNIGTDDTEVTLRNRVLGIVGHLSIVKISKSL